MPWDVFLTGNTGIIVSIVIFSSLVFIYHEVGCREEKFNTRIEMLTNMDKRSMVFQNKMNSKNDLPIQDITFEPGDISEMQSSLSDEKRKFKL